MVDHKGRVDSSTQAVDEYRLELARDERPFFAEIDVCFYWDDPDRSQATKPLNFLCAQWQDFIQRYSPHAFIHSWGADCRGWPGGNGFNSAGLFGQFLQYEELSVAERLEVLIEICRVEECGWARQMLRGFIRNYRMTDDDGYIWERPIRHQGDLGEIADIIREHFENAALEDHAFP